MTGKEYILKQKAAAESSEAVIGALCWWTIRNQVIEHTTLEEIVREEGLEEYLPNPIRPCGAFRRATRMLQKDTQPAGDADSLKNEECVLVREVDCTDSHIYRKLVTEIRDRDNKELCYEQDTNVIFDKARQAIEITGADQQRKELILNNYTLLNGRYNGERLRVLVKNVIDSTHPTLIRPSGSVYFIPSAHQHKMEKLERVIRQINEKGLLPGRDSTFEYIYVVDSERHREMVWQRFEHQTIGQVNAFMQEAAEALKKSAIKASTAAAYMQRINHVKEAIKEYEQFLERDLVLCKEKLRLAERQAIEILTRVHESGPYAAKCA